MVSWIWGKSESLNTIISRYFISVKFISKAISNCGTIKKKYISLLIWNIMFAKTKRYNGLYIKQSVNLQYDMFYTSETNN